MFYTALLIPADMLSPLEPVGLDTSDADSWPELINIPDNHLGFTHYPSHGVWTMFDEDALLRDPRPEVNLRMNLMDGKLTNGSGIRLTNMLRGDFLLTGVNADGETCDLPQTMIDLAREVHREAVVLNRKVSEAQVGLRQKGVIN